MPGFDRKFDSERIETRLAGVVLALVLLYFGQSAHGARKSNRCNQVHLRDSSFAAAVAKKPAPGGLAEARREMFQKVSQPKSKSSRTLPVSTYVRKEFEFEPAPRGRGTVLIESEITIHRRIHRFTYKYEGLQFVVTRPSRVVSKQVRRRQSFASREAAEIALEDKLAPKSECFHCSHAETMKTKQITSLRRHSEGEELLLREILESLNLTLAEFKQKGWPNEFLRKLFVSGFRYAFLSTLTRVETKNGQIPSVGRAVHAPFFSEAVLEGRPGFQGGPAFLRAARVREALNMERDSFMEDLVLDFSVGQNLPRARSSEALGFSSELGRTIFEKDRVHLRDYLRIEDMEPLPVFREDGIVFVPSLLEHVLDRNYTNLRSPGPDGRGVFIEPGNLIIDPQVRDPLVTALMYWHGGRLLQAENPVPGAQDSAVRATFASQNSTNGRLYRMLGFRDADTVRNRVFEEKNSNPTNEDWTVLVAASNFIARAMQARFGVLPANLEEGFRQFDEFESSAMK